MFVLFLTLVFVTPSYAQWGIYYSPRAAYSLYRGDRDGLFFPRKDPEEPELSLGPVVFRPGLGLSETYTSNPTFAPRSYLDPSTQTLERVDIQDDFVTRLLPALGVKLPYKRNTFEAEYLGDFSWYSRQSRFNADDHYFTARGQVNVFRDSWIYLQSVTGLLHTPVEDVRTYIPVLDRRRRFNHYSNYIAFHPPWYKKFGLSVRYSNTMSRYEAAEDSAGDFTFHHPGVLLRYTVWRRTRLLLGYDFIDYTTGQQVRPRSDYQEHSLIFGVEHSLAERLRMTVEGTSNWDRFKDTADALQVWGARVHARYTPLERLAFEAGYRRTARPTLAFTTDRFDPIADTISLYYIEDVAELSCEYRFRRNLLFWANVTYKRFDFPKNPEGLARQENIYGGTLQLIYTFRPWLRFSVAGGYSVNDSNDPFQRYENAMGQITIQGYL